MEKVDIIIQIEVGRLKALDFFLFDKQKSSLKAELEKAADALYEKYVPEDTRRFIDSQARPAPAAKNRPKRNAKVPALKSFEEEVTPNEQS